MDKKHRGTKTRVHYQSPQMLLLDRGDLENESLTPSSTTKSLIDSALSLYSSETDYTKTNPISFKSRSTLFLILYLILQAIIVGLVLFVVSNRCRSNTNPSPVVLINQNFTTTAPPPTTTKTSTETFAEELHRPVRYGRTDNGDEEYFSKPLVAAKNCTECSMIPNCPIYIVFVIDVCTCGELEITRLLRSVHLIFQLVGQLYNDSPINEINLSIII